MTPFLDAMLLPKEYYDGMRAHKRTIVACACAVGALNVGYAFVYANFERLFFGKGIVSVSVNALLSVALALAVGLIDVYVYCKPLVDIIRRVPGIRRPAAASPTDDAGGQTRGGLRDAASHDGNGMRDAVVGAPPSAGADSSPPDTASAGADSLPSSAATAGAADSSPEIASAGDGSAAKEAVAAAAAAGSAAKEAVAAAAEGSPSLGSPFARAAKVYALSSLIVSPLAILVQVAYLRIAGEVAPDAQVNVVVAALALMQVWAFGIMTRGLCGILGCKGIQRAFVFFVVAAWSIIWSVTFSSFVLGNAVVQRTLLGIFA